MTPSMLSEPVSASIAKYAIVDADERVRLDPFGRAGDRRHEDAQRLRKRLRALGRVFDDLDVVAEATLLSCAHADLDVERDMRRHVVVREAKDTRGRGAVAADARCPHPLFRGDDPAHLEQVFGVVPRGDTSRRS